MICCYVPRKMKKLREDILKILNIKEHQDSLNITGCSYIVCDESELSERKIGYVSDKTVGILLSVKEFIKRVK